MNYEKALISDFFGPSCGQPVLGDYRQLCGLIVKFLLTVTLSTHRAEAGRAPATPPADPPGSGALRGMEQGHGAGHEEGHGEGHGAEAAPAARCGRPPRSSPIMAARGARAPPGQSG